MKNAYPKKPVLQYRRTQVEMGAVVAYLQSLTVPAEVKRAAYIMFRYESANGRSGINDNYIGAQADGGRWPVKFDDKIIGTVTKNENGTGKQRIFLAFSSWRDSVDFLVERVQSRGLYIGGYERLVTKKDVNAQVTTKEAYARGWLQPQLGVIMSVQEKWERLKPVCLCVAYKRSWVTGKASYMPSVEEVKGFISMYRQAEKIFT